MQDFFMKNYIQKYNSKYFQQVKELNILLLQLGFPTCLPQKQFWRQELLVKHLHFPSLTASSPNESK